MPADVTAPGRATPPVAPPEPGLTPAEMVARATALRPLLRSQQAETEARTHPSDEIHQACLDAGFYRCYVPRRYGGYEFDAVTYMRVVQELSRGCLNTGWCVGLAAAHALQIGSWFEQRAQDEIFGDGDFRAAAVAAPIGAAVAGRRRVGPDRPGRLLLGHPVLDALHGAGADRRRRRPADRADAAVRRAAQRVRDPRRLGRPDGAQGDRLATRITFDHGRIPAHWAIEDALMVDFDVSARHAGLRAARQPDVRRACDGPLHVDARRGWHRRRLPGARRATRRCCDSS